LPQTGKANLKKPVPALALHSFSKAIEIAPSLRKQPLGAWQTSARLTTLLDRFGIRVLGDLHGRKVVDFAWEKNCGSKTLYELDLLARRARSKNGQARRISHRHRGTDLLHLPSRNVGVTGNGTGTAEIHEDPASFAIPESVCHLSLQELPITTRLANVVRSTGARSLGDLNGRDAFELLQYKACGWGTISEVQQLIERAVSGEFDIGQIEETTAPAELLRLLERGLTKLPRRNREFLFARIGAQVQRGRSPRANLLCPSHAEIGRRYGLTRARVHKVFGNSLDSLRKSWGPRILRLLQVVKWRCLSMTCPLTPELLEIWIDSPATRSRRAMTRDGFSSFELSMKAHVRLIAALDKNIPCWLESWCKPQRTDDSVRRFDLALAQVVREMGGQISVVEAYRKLSNATGRDNRRLTIENFLRMLRSVEYTVVEFKDPRAPIVRIRASNGENLRVQIRTDQRALRNKTHPKSIPFFGTKSIFREHAAVGSR
jgi:hypothetical protein